ncbi:hypothetical protein ONS96_011377 [Cadophora gregata f. sp. sojae]|nr:hypothetical protein ONS96_011377 [Cadophora gregata f. sp. sojae]
MLSSSWRVISSILHHFVHLPSNRHSLSTHILVTGPKYSLQSHHREFSTPPDFAPHRSAGDRVDHSSRLASGNRSRRAPPSTQTFPPSTCMSPHSTSHLNMHAYCSVLYFSLDALKVMR